MNRIDTTPPPNRRWKFKVHSFTKMVVYPYPNSERVVRYSIDWTNSRKAPRDQRVGLNNLKKVLQKEFPGFHHALFYDITSDKLMFEIDAKGNCIQH